MLEVSETKIKMRALPLICLFLLLLRTPPADSYLGLVPTSSNSIAKLLLSSKALDQSQQADELQNIDIESLPTRSEKPPASSDYSPASCQLVQVAHLLHHAGCQPKAIPSFACSGSCPSYVQTSTSKFWQHERSCSCCQQTGSREATFTLDCPSLDPPFRRVKTYAPVNCMCRSCTDLNRENLRPQELVETMSGGDVG